MMELKKRVFIVDENETGAGTKLSILIESGENLKLVGQYKNGQDAVGDVLRKRPDIVVMGIDLPGKNGIEMTQEMKSRFPHLAILLISGYDDRETVFAAFKAGADGYLLATENCMELLKGIEELATGGAPMSRNVARLVVSQLHTNMNSMISNREKQVMQMISSGMTYTEISEALNISKETSRTHIRNIYSKLKVNSKSQAISKAKEERLI